MKRFFFIFYISFVTFCFRSPCLSIRIFTLYMIGRAFEGPAFIAKPSRMDQIHLQEQITNWP